MYYLEEIKLVEVDEAVVPPLRETIGKRWALLKKKTSQVVVN